MIKGIYARTMHQEPEIGVMPETFDCIPDEISTCDAGDCADLRVPTEGAVCVEPLQTRRFEREWDYDERMHEGHDSDVPKDTSFGHVYIF